MCAKYRPTSGDDLIKLYKRYFIEDEEEEGEVSGDFVQFIEKFGPWIVAEIKHHKIYEESMQGIIDKECNNPEEEKNTVSSQDIDIKELEKCMEEEEEDINENEE